MKKPDWILFTAIALAFYLLLASAMALGRLFAGFALLLRFARPRPS